MGTSRGTVVVGGRIYRESIKITQKLVNVFYIYCNIEARTSTIPTERISVCNESIQEQEQWGQSKYTMLNKENGFPTCQTTMHGINILKT